MDLRWDQVDFVHAGLHVRRAKKGTPATHPVVGDEAAGSDPKSRFVLPSLSPREQPPIPKWTMMLALVLEID